MIKIGCCGFSTAQAKYASIFPVVEIDSSFYQLPKIETAERWRKTTPPGFEFMMKAWQLVTHSSSSPTYKRLSHLIPESRRNRYGSFQATSEVRDAWQKTLAVAEAMKATAILLQTPATFIPTSDNVGRLQQFLQWAPRGSCRLAWEPRGHWPLSLLVQIFKKHHLIHVVDPLKSPPVPSSLNYFRAHGSYEGRRIIADYRYTDSELKKIKDACDKPVNYVFFNNMYMLDDAKRFAQLVSPSILPPRRHSLSRT